MYKNFSLLIIIGIICLCFILLWKYFIHNRQSEKILQSSSVPVIEFDFGHQKSFQDIIEFHGVFQTPPIILSSVVNISDGGDSFNGSVVAVKNSNTTQFSVNVFKSWPNMGIYWMAFDPNSKYFETRTITEVIPIYSPPNESNPFIFFTNVVVFNKTYSKPPIVICTANSPTMGDFQLTVMDVSTTFFSLAYNTWPTNGVNILVIPIDIDKNILPFQLDFGKIDSTNIPSVGNWKNTVIFKEQFQYSPTLVGTPFFNKVIPSSPFQNNITFDSVSRKLFHINIQNGWPTDGGIQWVAFSKKAQKTYDSYPIQIVSDYIIYEPSKTSDEQNYIIKFDSQHRMDDYEEQCIIAIPIDVVHATSSNEITTPKFPLIQISELTNDTCVCQVNPWPIGGVQYMKFGRNILSKIEQTNEKYIIDLGIFDIDAFPSNNQGIIRIPFNFEFPEPPKIITSYHGFMDYDQKSSIQIAEIFTSFFTFSSNPNFLNKLLKPTHSIHWVAIYENQSFTQNKFPYSINLGKISSVQDLVQTLDHPQPDHFSALNDIFGIVSFPSPYTTQPIMIIGSGFLGIDTIHNNFFHVNTSIYPTSLEYIFKDILPITWMTIVNNNQNTIPFYVCENQKYIDPSCPSLKTNSPVCSTFEVISYLPHVQYKYLETVSNISFQSSDSSVSETTDYQPMILDDIVICNIHLSSHDNSAWSQYGEVCQNQTNHLLSDNEHLFTQWGINCDYGYFSNCTSFGSVLIRINTSFSSDKILTFHFYGVGISPNFKYYIQWGESSDMIQGPFDYDAFIELEFGQKGCAPMNVYCKIKNLFKDSCKTIITPFLKIPQNWTRSQVCSKAVGVPATATCIALLGGPENIFADAACPSFIGYPISSACNAYVKDAEDASDISRYEDIDKFASYICDRL
jgi:hypothetical protein